jgi:3-oxoacyl-[acyl-carrier protein] reductase
MTGLEGKCALVTGASRGIGRAIARAFAEAGASVALNYHTGAGQAEALADEIRAWRIDAFAIAADVADETAVDGMVGRVLERFGRIDLLVNNAGIILEAPLLATTTAEFDRIVAVNLRGTFLVGRACLRHMVEAGIGGRVINLASDLGYLGRAEFSAYSATKGAILALTRSWAREFAPDILVNAIAPGPIETDMLSPESMSPEWLEKEKDIPLARFGLPEEVAAVALFLAGPGATFVTGQAIGPNGGSVMI